MKKSAAPERAPLTDDGTETPPGWTEVQHALAADAGLSLLLVEGRQPPSLVVSNNNSICHAFQSSPAHAHLCDPFCGEAFDRAREAGGRVDYRCHAGFHCFAMPVELGAGRPLAVIGGRAFLRSADYRRLAERLRAGDLSDLLGEELFRNVVFAIKQDLDELAANVSDAAGRVRKGQGESARNGWGGGGEGGEGAGRGAGCPPEAGGGAGKLKAGDLGHGFAPGRSLKEACLAAFNALVRGQDIESLALLLRLDDAFTPVCTTGRFTDHPPRLALKAREVKLLQAASGGESITIPVPSGARTASRQGETAELFPLVVGDEVRGALLVADTALSAEQRAAVSAFCRELAMPLEVYRLREELERRSRASKHLRAFTEVIGALQPEEAYSAILQHSTQLLRAERGSLLLFDEQANELLVKAALGPRADAARETRVALGEGVSGVVMREGRPVVVRDVAAAGWPAAPPERSYKTSSFISYPIIIGGRKVGVLNVTDKAGGGAYDEVDLRMLETIAPQLALALDRAEWHQKATQFQLLSITDALTGLLNRRYLEERLSEELERSKRHRFPMSFLMMDIDDFKHYNDRNGHQAGDLALEMTAQCLKSALRSADVAARYGGEEFSILLPQTGLSEAVVIAERIRRRVERTHFPHGLAQPQGALTVSIGISAFGPHADTPAAVIAGADQALYKAKSRGKNCVDVSEPPASSHASRDPQQE